MKCKCCNSEKLVKNGKPGGKQRYKCKDCDKNTSERNPKYSTEQKIRVIMAYLRGVGIRAM